MLSNNLAITPYKNAYRKAILTLIGIHLFRRKIWQNEGTTESYNDERHRVR